MINQGYSAHPDGTVQDPAITDRGLLVNSTGSLSLIHHFTTDRAAGRQDYTLLYPVRGRLHVSVQGGMESMHPGQIILYPPGAAHRYAHHGAEPLHCYWIHFTGRDAQDLLDRCGLPRGKIMTVGTSDAADQLFDSMFREFIRRDACCPVAVAGHLMTLFALLGRAANAGAMPRHSRVLASLEYMHRHHALPLSVGQLAEIEGLSPSRYRAVFRAATGQAPGEYLIRLRLRRACELMEQTQLPLAMVAEMVGYADPRHFSRIFKQRMGSSPRSYARRCRAGGEIGPGKGADEGAATGTKQ